MNLASCRAETFSVNGFHISYFKMSAAEYLKKLAASAILLLFGSSIVAAQKTVREFPAKIGASAEIVNYYGRVEVVAVEDSEEIQLSTEASADDLRIKAEAGKFRLEVVPKNEKTRIDLLLRVPERLRLNIETRDGEVQISGNFDSASVKTETGTIAAEVPLENLKYDFSWTASRPRLVSDATLEDVKEKAAGRFVVSGKLFDEEADRQKNDDAAETGENAENNNDDSAENPDENPKVKKSKKRNPKKSDNRVALDFTTARGIILLNVKPGEVPSDLSERQLTGAAKAIIRSGDSLLTDAIRRASPKFFGDYAKTLPPRKTSPFLSEKSAETVNIAAPTKRVLVRVMDLNNRAIDGLTKDDFVVQEAGTEREILSVKPTTAPFNLVLLVDVSGSVDNYIDFIRKAARDFVNTVDKNDRVAIVLFNEDVQILSNFTIDKEKLSRSLDTFDAGGGTAFYDALAFTLVDTLRPLKGERTAIVALTDGDDNRSFLPFDSLLGSIQESGALIYPLYVPSALVAASATNDPNQTIDPLRTRYYGLTTKAEGEGEKLAQISGGVYYPISRLSQIQAAYDDIVKQLRSAYTITFRSDSAETSRDGNAPPRLRVRVKRADAFVKLGSVTSVSGDDGAFKSTDSPENVFPAQYFSSGFAPPNYFIKTSLNNFFNDKFEISDLKLITNDKTNPQGNFVHSTARENRGLNENPENSNNRREKQTGEISGEIERIKYQQFLGDKLRESDLENFDINKAQGAFVVKNGGQKIAASRWISPKRTRSYPYERVYDTLAFDGKKAAIIPVVKDEGLGGERDFLQWDTISLLSLLDVRVILAYYDSAEKNAKRADQITKQQFDNGYIKARLKELFEFKGTTREWNEREAKQLKPVFEKAKTAYQKISAATKTYLHDESALNEIIEYTESPEKFIEFSRGKSRKAQNREFNTLQPKEALATDTKGKVTITNALFGKYFFTVDETRIAPPDVFLIEAKHSQRGKMPNKNDIKDGLIKMMIYTNLHNGRVGKTPANIKAQIRLTGKLLKGSINSDAADEDLAKFFVENAFDVKQQQFVKTLFEEARTNKFTIILEHAETAN